MASSDRSSHSSASAFGKYEVIARLGRGGMAQVFLAVARGLAGFNKLVVIKRLDSDDESFKRMFLDEARVAALLRQPNVVDTYEAFEHDGSYFIVMEFLDGQPLNRIIRRAEDAGEKLPPSLCARLIADALSGLHYAHELRDYAGVSLNVVHRDVSPQNLFLTHDGRVKVIDFGIAKTEASLTETAIGVVKGKLAYMSPEQALGAAVDRRADIFSAGVVLWELLTLEKLVTRESTMAAARELRERLENAPELMIGVDPKLANVVEKALAREPNQRFQTAQAMRDALLLYLLENPFSQEDLALFMREHFESARQDLQRRIQDCLHATERDPVISVMDLGETSESELVSELTTLDRVPNLTSDRPTRPSSKPPGERRRRRAWSAAFFLVMLVGVALGAWQQGRLSAEPKAISSLATLPTPSALAPIPSGFLLRLHGSNTIGRELGPALAEAFLRQEGFAKIERVAGAKPEQTLVSGKAHGDQTPQVIEVEAAGSATAFTDLAAGTCDIGLASRAIKPDEAAQLMDKGLGDLRSPAGEHVLGLDGIAVIAHPNNPLHTLDLNQLQQIFTGELQDLTSAGGDPGRPNLYARDNQSGTYDTFKHLVLGEQSLATDTKRFVDSESLSDAVVSDVHGLGFVGVVYVRGAKALAIGEPGSLPLYPSAFTVATEDYALSRRLYLYTAVQATTVVRDFVNFALSADGQKVVKSTGFVDLNPSISEPRACDARCGARYATLTRGAKRVSLDFRFRSGSTELDSRALRDLERLVSFLREINDPKLALLGFSDSRGTPSQNLALSRGRAQKVESELSSRGVHAVQVVALGQEMAVASNESEAGREKNRRVEVWLK